MTTIAYRDGVLAADGRSTRKDLIISDDTQKIHRLSDGSLFALAGDDAFESALIRSLEFDDPLPKHAGSDDCDFIAVVVETDGSLWTYEGVGGWSQIEAEFAAFGSGVDFAYGAMEMGASAKEAVQVAMRRDKNSGGRLQYEYPGYRDPLEN